MIRSAWRHHRGEFVPSYLDEQKPAIEWLLGGPVRKVSPKRTHSLLQAALVRLVGPWADERGELGTEWRFWLEPPGEEARYLVPDLAFVSSTRAVCEFEAGENDESHVASDVVFEILSPDDRASHVEHKIGVYFRAGTSLVVVIDPNQRTIRTADPRGERTMTVADRFEHPALPGLRFDLGEFFAKARRR